MEGCFHSTPEGNSLVDMMNSEFGLSIESASHIADVSRTSVDRVPFTEKSSKLFRDLTAMYGSEDRAAKIKSICYSDEFFDQFGNWVSGISDVALNSDGEPEIVWTHQDKNDSKVKFENSIGLAIVNALEDQMKLNSEYATYKMVVDRLREFTILKNRLDAGEVLSKEEKKRITNKKTASNEEVRLYLLRGILGAYNNIRFMLKDINLTPAFIKPTETIHWTNGTSSYKTDNWAENVIALDKSSVSVLDILPKYVPKDVTLKLSKTVPTFTLSNRTVLVNPNLTFKTVDDYFSTTTVGKNKTFVLINAWNEFKSRNRDFIERLLNKNSDLIHFIEAFCKYKVNAFENIYNNGKNINDEAFEFAKRCVILTDEPFFGVNKFAIITNDIIKNKKEALKQLEPYDELKAMDELYADGQTDQYGYPSNPSQERFARNAERFTKLFGDKNKISGREALLAIIDNNSPLADVAKVLLKQGTDITIEILDELLERPDHYMGSDTAGGAYFPDQNVIRVSRNMENYPDATIIHEIIHANTYWQIRSDKYRDKAAKIFNEARNLIFKKYNVNSLEELQSVAPNDVHYGLKNIDEFFSMLWTSSAFIKELNSVGTQRKTVWLKLKEFLLNIIKIPKTSKVFNDASNLLDAMITESGTDYLYREERMNDPEFLEQFEQLPDDFFVDVQLNSAPYEGETFYGDINGIQDYFGMEKGLVEISQTLSEKPLTDWTNHSGGAIGSDSYWGEIGLQYGVTSNHYYHGRRTPSGNIEITQEEFDLGKEKVYKANEYLGRKNFTQYMDLLARNYIQVKNSDQIVAIGGIVGGLEKEDGKIWNASVNGGTGWAVEIAIEDNKPVYVYDQNRQQWYKNTGYSVQNGYRYFEPCETPVLSKNFAGIGTREINEAGKKAIEDCYRHTIVENADNLMSYRSELDNEGLSQASSIYIFDEVKFDEDGAPIPAHYSDTVKLYGNDKPLYLIDITTGNQYQYDDLLEFFGETKITKIQNNAGIKALNNEKANKELHNLFAKSALIKDPSSSVKTYEELHQQPVKTNIIPDVKETAELATASLVSNPIKYNKEQKQAIDGVVSAYKNKGKGQDIVTIIGKAGTGKTTIIGEILRQIAQGKNINVVCGAVSNKAKQNLYKKIIAACGKDLGSSLTLNARSIAGMLGKKPDKNGEVKKFVKDPLARKNAEELMHAAHVVIVDEVSMCGESVLADIESIAPNALIIYLGDIRQVKPIGNKADVAPGFTRGTKSFELLERVRLGEGSAVLDYADTFGDIALKKTSEITQEDTDKFLSELNQKESIVLDTNAMYTINGDVPNVVLHIYPIVKKAIEKDDMSYFHIVPFHIAARQLYNDLIRTLLVNEQLGTLAYSENPAASNYIGTYPYQSGEWITANEAYVSGKLMIDNGTDLKVLSVQQVNGLDYQNVYGVDKQGVFWDAHLDVWSLVCEYTDEDGKIKNINMLVPAPTPTNLKIFEAQKSILAVEAEANKKWNKYYSFTDKFADVSAPWALNVHKALGLTYEIAYVPVDDYSKHYYELIYFSLGDKKRPTVETCSELYTAITRSANVILLGSNLYQGSTNDDLVQRNESIKEVRKLNQEKSAAELIIEDTGGLVVEENDSPIIVPKELKLIHDLLKFITGNEKAFRNLKTKEGLDYLREIRSKLFQKETELLKLGHTFGPMIQDENGNYDFETIFKDKNILDTPINESTARNYPTIKNLTVKPALVIIPKLHASEFKLGNHTLAEINLDYFKTRNSFYRAKVDNIDFLVRTHTGRTHIAFSKNLESGTNAKYGKPIKVVTDELGYRLDANEKRMYKMPTNSAIFLDNKGNETLVIINPLKTEQDYAEAEKVISDFIDSVPNIISVQPFLSHFNNAQSMRNMILLASDSSVINVANRAFYKIGQELNILKIKEQLKELYDNKKTLKKYEDVLANSLYNSFVKSLLITSSRIPTQALASFMDMLVVAYNPSGANDVFVSMWLLWLQGSKIINWNL